MGLYIITHKYLDKLPTIKGFKCLYVGAFKQIEKRNEYFYDDTGNNISKKNQNYCELTGVYWLWKNCKDRNKGIAHYRRFFTKNSFSANPFFYYNTNELNKYLTHYDIIIAERLYVSTKSVYEDYCTYHYKKDVDILENIISEKFGDYSNAFDIVFKRNYYSPANMFYCDSKVFDAYCEWLFNVLSELEKSLDIINYNIEQARIYGFIGERLLNVWIEKNNLKVKELRIIQTDSRFRLRIRKKIDSLAKKAVTSKIKYNK